VDLQVLYTEPALADLEAILAWSWSEHPGSTENFALSLLNHVDLLKDFPYMGVRVKGYSGVRRLLHSPLHVYYRVILEMKRIEILHVWHSRRRPPLL
jgi:plasmid stabilization system protein ParE